MADIEVEFVDQTYVRLLTDKSRLMELKEQFSFFVPNYQFHPKFKAGYWDGRKSLINWKDQTILFGLLPKIVDFASERNYSIDIDPRIFASNSYTIDDQQVYQLYHKLSGPFKPHDTQVAAVKHCINNGRAIILAPTSEGKSYMQYALAGFHAKQKQRVLVVIHRSQLVKQLQANFAEEYNGNKHFRTHTIYDNVHPRNTDVLISTWQSIYEFDSKWFSNFDVLIGDEVHMFKAQSISKIIDNCGSVSTRYGFTATLDNDSKVDRLQLIGSFGDPHRVTTTKESIKAGRISKPTVVAIIREYSAAAKREIFNQSCKTTPTGRKSWDFVKEVNYQEDDAERNAFIAKLESSLNGNTIIAFKREAHGKNIVEAIKNLSGKDPYFINGTVDVNKRVDISNLINTLDNSTAVCSLGTFSTGVNIPNLNNLIVACQAKSKITVPQLIGRLLRKSEKKNTALVFDIGDDLTIGGAENPTYKHFQERLQIYAVSGFEVKIKKYFVR